MLKKTLLLSAITVGLTAMNSQQERHIFNFNSNQSESTWRIINDSVMGGISNSNIVQSNADYVTFRGNVSLENNGGFASIRSKPTQYELGQYKGIKLRIKGDGKTYKLRLRDNPNWGGPSYQTSFATQKGVWQEVSFKFEDFQPTFRGRALTGMPPLNTQNIFQFGILISDKQAGPFSLDIDWVRAY